MHIGEPPNRRSIGAPVHNDNYLEDFKKFIFNTEKFFVQPIN